MGPLNRRVWGLAEKTPRDLGEAKDRLFPAVPAD